MTKNHEPSYHHRNNILTKDGFYNYRFVLKGCPRCKGDMVKDYHHYWTERVCIQCGYREEVNRG